MACVLSLFMVLITSVAANTIFQELHVNGISAGHEVGIRVPSYNGPVTDVTSSDIVCNAGSIAPRDVIEVNAGDVVTTEWHHTLSGFNASDFADPIEAGRKGPIIVYLAKVDDALTTSTTGLNWFKIYEDGLTSGIWALDKLIANQGNVDFQIPKCIPDGEYLLRAEIITLNSAASYPGAEFYMECAQININGGGAAVPSTLSFPGAYKGSDAGITFDLSKNPSSYPIPGPAIFTCDDASSKEELKRSEDHNHWPHATDGYGGYGTGKLHGTGMAGGFGQPSGADISKSRPTSTDSSTDSYMRKRAFNRNPRQYPTMTSLPSTATESCASDIRPGTGMPFVTATGISASTADGVFPPGDTGVAGTGTGHHHHHHPHSTGTGFYGPLGTGAPFTLMTSTTIPTSTRKSTSTADGVTSMYGRNIRYRREAIPTGFPFAKDGGRFPMPTGEGAFYHYGPSESRGAAGT